MVRRNGSGKGRGSGDLLEVNDMDTRSKDKGEPPGFIPGRGGTI